MRLYWCAECKQRFNPGYSDFWETPDKGTYDFICKDCAKKIIEEGEDVDE